MVPEKPEEAKETKEKPLDDALFVRADFTAVAKKGRGRRGRFSRPICDRFMSTGEKCVKLQLMAIAPEREPASAASTLVSYLRLHPELPINIVFSNEEIVMIRTDM
jgi:hypothetical protein